MNKETVKYNTEFAKIKRKVLERDRWECKGQFIDHFGTLTVDHIVRRSLGGKNTFDNLITLCVGCHSIYEMMPSRGKVHQLRARLAILYGYEWDDKYSQ